MSRLALLGGEKTITGPLSQWPVYDEQDEQNLARRSPQRQVVAGMPTAAAAARRHGFPTTWGTSSDSSASSPRPTSSSTPMP